MGTPLLLNLTQVNILLLLPMCFICLKNAVFHLNPDSLVIGSAQPIKIGDVGVKFVDLQAILMDLSEQQMTL
ncbi:hypothetical protein NIES2100_11340 [Calothrix sp. NIES-2100]|uniref:hypothetical protein n=1 Tax=Calothrix sp. NIES-2100 TaxID=1954172 RepID=UPI000B60DA20|nr:hypothetical protein NIES2100_11340 [Calothrix sp. NIES-2100]